MIDFKFVREEVAHCYGRSLIWGQSFFLAGQFLRARFLLSPRASCVAAGRGGEFGYE